MKEKASRMVRKKVPVRELLVGDFVEPFEGNPYFVKALDWTFWHSHLRYSIVYVDDDDDEWGATEKYLLAGEMRGTHRWVHRWVTES